MYSWHLIFVYLFSIISLSYFWYFFLSNKKTSLDPFNIFVYESVHTRTQSLTNKLNIILCYWRHMWITTPWWQYISSVSYTHLDVYKRQTIGREYSTNQGCMQKIIWFCLYLRLLSFAIENTLDKKNVAGKLPLSLNRSSPKTIGLENSTN